MGSYYTTIKAVSTSGKPAKVAVSCGGVYKGFTDEKKGELSFDLYSDGAYDVVLKSSIFGNASGSIKGGEEATFRLK